MGCQPIAAAGEREVTVLVGRQFQVGEGVGGVRCCHSDGTILSHADKIGYAADFQAVRVNPHLKRPWLTDEDVRSIVFRRIDPCEFSVFSCEVYSVVLFAVVVVVQQFGSNIHIRHSRSCRTVGDTSADRAVCL